MDYTSISDRLAVSPQIALEDIEALAKDGFTGIVNNRPAGESPDQSASPVLKAKPSDRLWTIGTYLSSPAQ